MICLIDVPEYHSAKTLSREEIGKFAYSKCLVSKRGEKEEHPSVMVSLALPSGYLTVHVMGEKAQSISESDYSNVSILEMEFWKLVLVYVNNPYDTSRIREVITDISGWSTFYGKKEVQDSVAQILGLKRDH